MDVTSSIFVAGHQELIGSATLRLLQTEGYKNILTRERLQLDLTDAVVVEQFFRKEKPEYVVLAAGRSGGIVENQRVPADFLYDNLAISLNILNSAQKYGVKKLLYFASSCMYPKNCPQPMTEDMLLTGKPEETSLGTAIAKLAGLELCLAYNRQYGGTHFIPVIPNNTYGANDNFNPDAAHVLSALIHRLHEAKCNGMQQLELWGSGKPRREFIHADDVATACLLLLKSEIQGHNLPINIGTGEDYSIFELAEVIARIVGYKGDIVWDKSKPDGTPRKLLDSTRIHNLGWKPSIMLEEGIKNTYRWYMENI